MLSIIGLLLLEVCLFSRTVQTYEIHKADTEISQKTFL